VQYAGLLIFRREWPGTYLCILRGFGLSSSDTSGAVAERLLKLAIALTLMVLILGPVLALSMHLAAPQLTDYVSRNILHSLYKSSNHGGITSGPDYYALEELEDKVSSFAAYRGEAKNAARTLQVLLVTFEGPQAAAASASALLPIKLDMSGARETAVVIVADRPLLIEFDGKAPTRRAMLGVEGIAPFDLRNAPKGVLSGFKIAAFGAHRVARPDQVSSAKDARIFCGAIKNWRTFYGLALGAVRMDAATDATSFKVTDVGVTHDGKVQVDVPDLGTFCRHH
jgi:hypothetical protein